VECGRFSFIFSIFKKKNMITEKEYQAAEDWYFAMSDKEIEKLATESAEEQPAIFVYIAANYENVEDEDNKEFFLQLIYSTWLAYKHKYTFKRKLSIKDLEKQDEADEKLVNDLSGNDDALMEEVLKRMTTHPQAQLIGHLYTLIGDFFGLDQYPDKPDEMTEGYDPESGIISGVINSFVSLLEKARNPLSAV
jgi:hypothetical protein